MKVFYPIACIYVNASMPHPPKTQYKVSIGTDILNGNPLNMIKIQMVYNGKIEGRKGPSFPVNTNDFENVYTAIKSLIQKYNEVNKHE